MSRLRDGQLGDERVHDIANYIVRGKLWDAFEADEPVVVLIDEVDKADIEFPNDLLLELDRMQFFVYETRRTIVAKHRPAVTVRDAAPAENRIAQQRRQLAQRERPADAVGVVFVEIAFGSAAGAANTGDQEFHAGFLARRGRAVLAGLGLTAIASVSSAHIFSSP